MVTPAEIDQARRIFGAIVGGLLIGGVGHETLHAAAVRFLGGAWRMDGWLPLRVEYHLPESAPRWHDHAIRMAPQLVAWPVLALALWVGWPPADVAHVTDWVTLLALGAGGGEDYETIIPAARAWIASWGSLERLLAVVLAATLVGSVGAAYRIGALYLWGGIVAGGVLTGLMLAHPRPEGFRRRGADRPE